MSSDGEPGPLVHADGKWLVGGLIAYLQGEYQELRAVGCELPPGLPAHCLDPGRLAHFFGVPVDELDWPGPAAGVTAALTRIEAKLDAGTKTVPVRSSDAAHLTLAQVADEVGVSYSHVRRAVLSGALPAANVGSERRPTYRIARHDLTAWLDRRRAGAGAGRPDLKELVARHLPGLRVRKDSATRRPAR